MKVVFLQDVPNVAGAGDVKEVKDGYARNYLIPKRLAAPATPNELQRVESLKRAAQERRLKETEEWQEFAAALEGKTITIRMKTGASGQLYGSVTNAIIAEELSRAIERPIERRGIVLQEPIRKLGTYQVPVHLHENTSANISVVVEAEQGPEQGSGQDAQQG